MARDQIGCENEVVFQPAFVPVNFDLSYFSMGIRGEGPDEPHKMISGTLFIIMTSEPNDGREAMRRYAVPRGCYYPQHMGSLARCRALSL